MPFFTIGHSNRSIEDFIAPLTAEGIGLLVDIRKIPRSRANPQFNEDTFPDALSAAGIAYERIDGLGGRRGKDPTISPEVNGFWTHQSFHNYADYALSADFHAALDHLIDAGHRRRCAIMCSEAVWWRCHRRIVADHLIARGEKVLHIMAPGRTEPAQLTSGAVVRNADVVLYPRPA